MHAANGFNEEWARHRGYKPDKKNNKFPVTGQDVKHLINRTVEECRHTSQLYAEFNKKMHSVYSEEMEVSGRKGKRREVKSRSLPICEIKSAVEGIVPCEGAGRVNSSKI